MRCGHLIWAIRCPQSSFYFKKLNFSHYIYHSQHCEMTDHSHTEDDWICRNICKTIKITNLIESQNCEAYQKTLKHIQDFCVFILKPSRICKNLLFCLYIFVTFLENRFWFFNESLRRIVFANIIKAKNFKLMAYEKTYIPARNFLQKIKQLNMLKKII